MKWISVSCLFLLCNVSLAQDFAPSSLVDMIYLATTTSRLDDPLNLTHSAVLSKEGGLTQLFVPDAAGRAIGLTSYSWRKTGPASGLFELRVNALSVAQTLRLEVSFTTAGRGKYRQISEKGSAVVEGNISFEPVPKDSIAPLLNLSTRSTVFSSQPIVTGFVVSGAVARRVLVRAIGPSLAQFGVVGAVANPALAVFGGATQIGGNSGWGGATTLASVFASVGAFSLPATSRDCALLLTLEPGNYTAQVRSETAGEVLVEVYLVD